MFARDDERLSPKIKEFVDACHEMFQDEGAPLNPRLARYKDTQDYQIQATIWESFSGVHAHTNNMWVQRLYANRPELMSLISVQNFDEFMRNHSVVVKGDKFFLDRWEFKSPTLQQKSNRMYGQLLTHKRSQTSQSVGHYGVGFRVSQGWINDETQRKVYEKYMQALSETVQLTLDYTLATRMVTTALEFQFNDAANDRKLPFQSKRDLSKAFDERNRFIFSIQKDGVGWSGVEGKAMQILRDRDFSPSAVLVTSGIPRLNNLVNPEQRLLPKVGLGRDLQDLQYERTNSSIMLEKKTKYKGLNVIISRSYELTEMGQPVDPTKLRVFNILYRFLQNILRVTF